MPDRPTNGLDVITDKYAEALSAAAVPQGTSIKGWKLLSCLMVQIRTVPDQAIATTWLETVAEYGVGLSHEEAIADLIASIGEYRESLGRREAQLSLSALKELNYLSSLIERSAKS